jgi:hypothetical protein
MEAISSKKTDICLLPGQLLSSGHLIVGTEAMRLALD